MERWIFLNWKPFLFSDLTLLESEIALVWLWFAPVLVSLLFRLRNYVLVVMLFSNSRRKSYTFDDAEKDAFRHRPLFFNYALDWVSLTTRYITLSWLQLKTQVKNNGYLILIWFSMSGYNSRTSIHMVVPGFSHLFIKIYITMLS